MGMLEINQTKQLKEFQRKNGRLKRMLADEMLGKELLKEVLEKSCKPRTQATDGREACLRGSMYGTIGPAGILGCIVHLRVKGERSGCLGGKVEGSFAPEIQ
jgi:hypothetical protein